MFQKFYPEVKMSAYRGSATVCDEKDIQMAFYSPLQRFFIHPCKGFLFTPAKVGSWHDQHGFRFLNHPTESHSELVESLENKTLVVTTIKVSYYKLLVANISLKTFITFIFAVAPLCSAG